MTQDRSRRWPLLRRRVGRIILHPVLFTLAHTLLALEVENRNWIPPHGALIIVFNHINALDPFVVSALMPRYAVAVSKEENLDVPVAGLLMRYYGVIFLRRGTGDREALRYSEEVLREEHILLMAPEGTRSRNGALIPAKAGLGFLSRRTGALVQPVAVTGTPNCLATWKQLRRPPVRVVFGRAFRVKWDAIPGRRAEAYLTVTDQVMIQLARLLPPQMRGVYRGRVQEPTPYLQPVESIL